MREERPQDARLQVLLGELLSGLALLRMSGRLGWDEERWQELCALLRWDGRPNPPDIAARFQEWRTYSPSGPAADTIVLWGDDR